MKNESYAVERALRAAGFGAMLGGIITIGLIATLIILMRAVDGVWMRFELTLARDIAAWLVIGPVAFGLVWGVGGYLTASIAGRIWGIRLLGVGIILTAAGLLVYLLKQPVPGEYALIAGGIAAYMTWFAVDLILGAPRRIGGEL
jgi:Flp pilus assembly pilin Flp